MKSRQLTALICLLIISLLLLSIERVSTLSQAANMSTLSPPLTGADKYQTFLTDAATQLQAKFSIGAPRGPITTDDKDLKAFQIFSSPTGPISIEVQEKNSWNGNSPSIFVAVPHAGLSGAASPATEWFEYTDTNGMIVPATKRDEYDPPSTLPPLLKNSGDWSFNREVDIGTTVMGNAPPHWNPVMVYNSDYQTNDYGNLHDLMQSGATQAQALKLLDRHRPVEDPILYNAVLFDRTTHYWPPVMLTGLAATSAMSDGDFGGAHATDYIDDSKPPDSGNNPPTGSDCAHLLKRCSYNWDADHFQGIDWLMHVTPDPAYNYIAAASKPGDVHVEIEHFAIPKSYRPKSGDWVQAAGRWVEDAGHADFHTEIHPVELLVSTKLNCDDNETNDLCAGSTSSIYRVMVTGAYSGVPIGFTVNPPPRPSANAVLHFKLIKAKTAESGFDIHTGVDLSAQGLPATNPNHLQLIISANPLAGLPETNPTPPQIIGAAAIQRPEPFADGWVGLRRNIRLETYVKCWWETPSADVQGSITTTNKQPAKGVYVFYRRADFPDAGWQYVQADYSGKFTIKDLLPVTYWFRPASSNYDFAKVPVKLLLQAGTNQLDFSAAPEPYPTPKPSTTFTQAGTILKPFSNPPHYEPADLADLNQSPIDFLTGKLVEILEPDGPFGVKFNGFGLPEKGRIVVHLSGLTGKNQQPVPDLASAYTSSVSTIVSGTTVKTVKLYALVGDINKGVKGAKIRATLLLGNLTSGYHAVQVVDATTDSDGNATFMITSGMHPEEAFLNLEVLSNPYNSWFKPKGNTSSYLFQPRKMSDDISQFVGFDSHTPYTLAWQQDSIFKVYQGEATNNSLSEFIEESKSLSASKPKPKPNNPTPNNQRRDQIMHRRPPSPADEAIRQKDIDMRRASLSNSPPPP